MKVQRIYESSLEINFNFPGQEYSLYWKSFLASEIGKLYIAIPWDDLVCHFKIKETRKAILVFLSPKGMIALMFLKSYVGCSDRKLIEHFKARLTFLWAKLF